MALSVPIRSGWWPGDAVMRGRVRFKDDVAPALMNPRVAPVLDKLSGERLAGEVSRQLHAVSNSSSRRRWSLIADGMAVSKK